MAVRQGSFRLRVAIFHVDTGIGCGLFDGILDLGRRKHVAYSAQHYVGLSRMTYNILK